MRKQHTFRLAPQSLFFLLLLYSIYIYHVLSTTREVHHVWAWHWSNFTLAHLLPPQPMNKTCAYLPNSTTICQHICSSIFVSLSAWNVPHFCYWKYAVLLFYGRFPVHLQHLPNQCVLCFLFLFFVFPLIINWNPPFLFGNLVAPPACICSKMVVMWVVTTALYSCGHLLFVSVRD